MQDFFGNRDPRGLIVIIIYDFGNSRKTHPTRCKHVFDSELEQMELTSWSRKEGR